MRCGEAMSTSTANELFSCSPGPRKQKRCLQQERKWYSFLCLESAPYDFWALQKKAKAAESGEGEMEEDAEQMDEDDEDGGDKS